MEDDFVHKNPWDGMEERFSRLEEKVVDISHNMALIMASLENNFIPFEEVGFSRLEVRSEEKPIDSENLEKEMKKRVRERKPSSNVITPSQIVFKMEVKVDINPYQGQIDVVNLNQWLQQLEVYFSVHNIDEETKVPFAQLKLEGHALT
jgi:hypothetical protein